MSKPVFVEGMEILAKDQEDGCYNVRRDRDSKKWLECRWSEKSDTFSYFYDNKEISREKCQEILTQLGRPD